MQIAFVLAASWTWWLEHREKKKLQNEKLELERKYFDERPKLGINIVSEAGRDAWRVASDSKNAPVHFFMQYLSGRIATSVR